jgi:hypothetical protein
MKENEKSRKIHENIIRPEKRQDFPAPGKNGTVAGDNPDG